MIIYEDNNQISESYKIAIIAASGVVMILFNLLFNNHKTFKDSFKLLTKNSRKKLIMQEKQDYLKSIE